MSRLNLDPASVSALSGAVAHSEVTHFEFPGNGGLSPCRFVIYFDTPLVAGQSYTFACNVDSYSQGTVSPIPEGGGTYAPISGVGAHSQTIVPAANATYMQLRSNTGGGGAVAVLSGLSLS